MNYWKPGGFYILIMNELEYVLGITQNVMQNIIKYFKINLHASIQNNWIMIIKCEE